MGLDLALQQIHSGSLETLFHLRPFHGLRMKLLGKTLVFLKRLDVVPGRPFHLGEGIHQLSQLILVPDGNIRLLKVSA